MTDEFLSRLPDERSETREGRKEEDRIWRQVMALIMAKARAVTAEVRCIRLSCDVLTPEEATALVTMLTRSVRQHVRDPAALQAIQREFEQIATTGRHDARQGYGTPPYVPQSVSRPPPQEAACARHGVWGTSGSLFLLVASYPGCIIRSKAVS